MTVMHLVSQRNARPPDTTEYNPAHQQSDVVRVISPVTIRIHREQQPSSLINHVLLQGYEPIIASPKGGKVPIDPKSVQEQYLTSTSRDFLKDGIFAPPCHDCYSRGWYWWRTSADASDSYHQRLLLCAESTRASHRTWLQFREAPSEAVDFWKQCFWVTAVAGKVWVMIGIMKVCVVVCR